MKRTSEQVKHEACDAISVRADSSPCLIGSVLEFSCSISELKDFLKAVENRSDLGEVWVILRDFAAARRSAMVYRSRGNIDMALQMEQLCDEYVSRMPEGERW